MRELLDSASYFLSYCLGGLRLFRPFGAIVEEVLTGCLLGDANTFFCRIAFTPRAIS